MTVAHPPIPSGIPDVDRQWGGLAVGKAYLLAGRAGAGRSAIALQMAQTALDEGVRTLLISPREPSALVEIGHSVGFDLPSAHASGALRILRIPDVETLAARGAEGLQKSYRDLVALVEADRPGRVVLEDFTPLVQFDTFERFHDAFAGLVNALDVAGATLIIGLGDPANDASRRLLEVVESLVHGSIRLGADGGLLLTAQPETEETRDSAPAREASVSDEPAEAPTPEVPDPAPEVAAMPRDEPPILEEPSHSVAEGAAAFSTRDGASVDTHAPAPTAPASPEAPHPSELPEPSSEAAPAPEADVSAPSADDFGSDIVEDGSSEPIAEEDGVPPRTEISPAPAPPPDLVLPSDDPFGIDPVEAIVDQGFLADSAASSSEDAGAAPVSFPLPPPQGASPEAAVGGAPAFAPLPAFAPIDDGATPAGFEQALEAAFAGRQNGTPFLIVALRMNEAAPEATHFDAVAAGLRAAIRPGDEVQIDAARKRAVVLLPNAGPEAGQALFAGLQTHLRSALSTDAEAVLRAVAAVTVPDGQPFETPAELMAYAYEN